MKAKTYGDDQTGFFVCAEYEPGVDLSLRPCPFCGSTDMLGCTNTHTPFFAVRCDSCGAEGPTSGRTMTKRQQKSKAATERVYAEAFHDALFLWNDRV